MANLGSTLVNGNLTVSGNINGYKLAAASAKNVDSSLSSGTTSTNIPTSKAVVDYVASAINSWKTNNTKTPGSISVSTSVNSNKGLDIKATASLAGGYYNASTLSGSATIKAGTLTASISGGSTFTPALTQGSSSISGISFSSTQPGAGTYYIGVTSASQTAKTITATAKATTGYYSSDTTKTDSTTVGLNGASTYVTIPKATFSYNSDSTGATFIQCHSSGYVSAGDLPTPSGSYDGVKFGISYTSSIKNPDGTSGVLKIYSPTSAYDPGTNAATITPTISNFNAGYVAASKDILDNVLKTYIPILSTTTSPTYTKPSVTTKTTISGMKTLSSGTNKYKISVANTSTDGSYSVTTTHALKDATTYKDSQYGLVKVGSEVSGGNTIGVNKSADATYYIQAGSHSLSQTSSGIKTSSTATSYSVSASSSITEGYQGSGSDSATTYIQAGSISQSAVSGTGTFTPVISKDQNATNVNSSNAVTTKPSGYYVAVSTASQTTKTVSGTVSITEGYQGAATKTVSGNVALKGSGLYYIPITTAVASELTSTSTSYSFSSDYFRFGGGTNGIPISASISKTASVSIKTAGYIPTGVVKSGRVHASANDTINAVNIPANAELDIESNSGTLIYLSRWRLSQSGTTLVFTL